MSSTSTTPRISTTHRSAGVLVRFPTLATELTLQMQTFQEFWPYYVCEHSKPATRALHFVGTVTATASLVVLIVIGKWYLFPLAFIPGYGAAWIGHFFIEHNRPATFKHPLWSFISDYKMVGLMIAGKMKEEVERSLTVISVRRERES